MRLLILLLAMVMTKPTVAQDLFPLWESLDDFRRAWYSEHLEAAGEAALSYPADGAIYRFTWLRTFHNPIVVSVACFKQCRMRAVRLSGAGGYDPGEIEIENERALTRTESEELEKLVEVFGPWRPQLAADDVGLDGAQWILEIVEPNRYVAWDMWCPADGDHEDYVSLASYILSLSAIELPKDEMY